MADVPVLPVHPSIVVLMVPLAPLWYLFVLCGGYWPLCSMTTDLTSMDQYGKMDMDSPYT